MYVLKTLVGWMDAGRGRLPDDHAKLMTRATLEVRPFFSEVPRFWELKTCLNPKTDL